MWNTCSIGRRWKSREGWSRPVLTGDRGTFFQSCWVGSRPVVVSRWMARNAVSCGHDDAGKAFCLRPLSGSRTATIGIGRVAGSVCRPIPCGWPLHWFCGGHGPGETPGPFPNPEAKAWHGDGTALERVWESSTPPHSTVWTFWSSPLGDSRKVLFCFAWGFPGRYARREPPFFMLSSGVRFPWRAGGSHSTTPPASHGLPA